MRHGTQRASHFKLGIGKCASWRQLGINFQLRILKLALPHALHAPATRGPLLFLAIPRWFCRAPTSAPAHAATPAATRQPLSGVTMGAGRDGNPASVGPLRRTWSSEKLAALQGVKDDLIVLKSIWFNKPKGGDHAQRLENFYSPQAAACESRCFGDQRMPLQFQRMGPFRAAPAALSRLDTRIW